MIYNYKIIIYLKNEINYYVYQNSIRIYKECVRREKKNKKIFMELKQTLNNQQLLHNNPIQYVTWSFISWRSGSGVAGTISTISMCSCTKSTENKQRSNYHMIHHNFEFIEWSIQRTQIDMMHIMKRLEKNYHRGKMNHIITCILKRVDDLQSAAHGNTFIPARRGRIRGVGETPYVNLAIEKMRRKNNNFNECHSYIWKWPQIGLGAPLWPDNDVFS